MELHGTARKRAQMVSCIRTFEAAGSPARIDEIAHSLGWDRCEIEDYPRVMAGLGWARKRDGTMPGAKMA
jgi:hypothetical protein